MNSTLEALASLNESTLKYVTSLQEGVLNAYRNVASMPRPEVPAGLSAWTPQPQPDLARSFVEETSSFAAKLIEANKAFALGLISADAAAAS